MKKIFFLALLPMILTINSFGQLQRHDLSFSAGIYSSNFFDAVSYDIFTDQNYDESISKTVGEQTGALYLTYRFFPAPKVTIGITGGFERVKGKIQTNSMLDGYYYNDYVSGALEIDYRYIKKPRFQLYSGAGIGIMFNEETNEMPDNYEFNENFNLAYQVNLIGIRYGGIFGVFLEAGFGYKGIIKAGMSVQL